MLSQLSACVNYLPSVEARMPRKGEKTPNVSALTLHVRGEVWYNYGDWLDSGVWRLQCYKETTMKIKLHRPRRSLWNLALLLFILGLLGALVPVPFLSGFAFYLVLASAALLLLGTWVI